MIFQPFIHKFSHKLSTMIASTCFRTMNHLTKVRLNQCSSGIFVRGIALRGCHGQSEQSSGFKSNDELLWQRKFYKYFLPIQTRWSDNDQYGHVNNVIYYSYFDTIINHYLIKHCGLNTDLKTSSIVGYMVDTNCAYRSPISFPEVALAGLTISHIGRSSVHYAVAIFPEEVTSPNTDRSMLSGHGDFGNHSRTACAVGRCIHVFVDAKTNRPAPLPDSMREALEKIAVIKETSKL